MCHPKQGRHILDRRGHDLLRTTEDEMEDSETIPHLINVPTLPLIIGPYRIMSTAQTASQDFVPPPYLVVEVDDGLEDEDDDCTANMEIVERPKRKIPSMWLKMFLYMELLVVMFVAMLALHH